MFPPSFLGLSGENVEVEVKIGISCVRTRSRVLGLVMEDLVFAGRLIFNTWSVWYDRCCKYVCIFFGAWMMRVAFCRFDRAMSDSKSVWRKGKRKQEKHRTVDYLPSPSPR